MFDNTDENSLSLFQKSGGSSDLDIDDIRRQSFLDSCLKWIPPFGMPNTISLKLTMRNVVANTGLLSSMKKDKKTKKAILDSEYMVDFLSKFAPESKLKKLSSGERAVMAMMSNPLDRRTHLREQVEKEKVEGVPEFFLINQYYEKLTGEVLVGEFQDLTLKSSLEPGSFDPDGLDRLDDKVLRGIRTGENLVLSMLGIGSELMSAEPTVKHILYRMAISGIIASAYYDLITGSDRASQASGFVFAISSLLFCRWPLDLVYQLDPAVYETHYSRLLYRTGAESSEDDGMEGYQPTSLNLLSEKTANAFLFYGKRSSVHALGMSLMGLANALEMDMTLPTEFGDDLFDAIDETERCYNVLKDLKKGLSEQAITVMPARIRDDLERLNYVFQQFFSAFPGEEGVDTGSLLEALDHLNEVLAQDHDDQAGWLYSSLAGIEDAVDEMEDNLGYALRLYDKLESQFRELSKDPAKNVAELQGVLTEMSDAKGQLPEVRANCEEVKESIVSCMMDVASALENRNVENKEDVETETDAGEAALKGHQDIQELFDISEAENKRLQKNLREVTAQNDHLGQALADCRSSGASGSMSEEARALITKKYVTKERITPEDSLKIAQHLYPDTVILPSAWTSAVESEKFEGGDTLSDYLITLAGDYRDSLTNGIPDSEARKLFPKWAFAANESETIDQGARRKNREFVYEGQTHYFQKHLRIGVADDVRKTIRVHFDVIDGKVVIAFCGQHA